MKVKNIIKNSAKLLNMKGIINAIDSDDLDNVEILEDLDDFMLAVNMVNNNIASNYIELTEEINISSSNGQILFKDMTDKNIIEIKAVKSGDVSVNYKININKILIADGNYNIEFSYFPNELNINDSIDYYTKISELLFAVGVVAEFLFIKGNIDEASIWDKKFKQSLFSLLRPKRNIIMPKRRWE